MPTHRQVKKGFKPLTAPVSDEMRELVRESARQREITMADIMVEALELYFEKHQLREKRSKGWRGR